MELLDSVKLPKYIYEDGKPRQNVWDTSSLSSFLACPRLYNLTNLNGYKMKSYGTVTGFGSAVHDGFEILDTGINVVAWNNLTGQNPPKLYLTQITDSQNKRMHRTKPLIGLDGDR